MIKSKDNPKIKEARKLIKEGRAIKIEGRKIIFEVLKEGLSPIFLFLTEKDPKLETLTQSSGGTVLFVKKNVLKSLSSLKTPQGQILLVKPPRWEEKSWKYVIILERVQDPTNLGSIIRTAYCLGYDAIYSDEETASPYSPKVLRSSSGYALKMPFFRVKNLEKKIIELRNKEFPIIGTFPKGGVSPEEMGQLDKFAIIFGNEGQGISQKLQNLLTERITLKMKQGESLNVSASAAIILYLLKNPLFL